MSKVDITVDAKNADIDPNGDTVTVTLTDVSVQEIVAELNPSDILEHLDKAEVMEYYKDDPDE